MTSPQTPAVPAAPGTKDDDRFQRGHMSEQTAQEYAQAVSAPDDSDKPEPLPEDAGARATRLARRRRLLGWGAPPAVLTAVVSVWLLLLSVLTLAGGHALTHDNHSAAVSRFALVERLDPWLSRWRVLYNLGTAEVLAEQGEAAVTHLAAALEVVPRGKTVTGSDGTQITDPRSDECKVRRNLYAAYYAQARTAAQPVSDKETAAKAQEALGGCEPPAQDNQTQPSPEPSQDPSQEPSQDPSQSPSPDPSQSPGQEPSATPSGQPSSEPSSSPSGSASPSTQPTASASPSPGKTPDPRASALASRNAQRERGVDRAPKRRW